MKALSVSSGYAALIAAGEKTIEVRTWQTAYRGELLICSNKDRIPGTIPGHALCIVKLVNVRPLLSSDLTAACMGKRDYDKSFFAWELQNICQVMPFPVRGKPALFDVDDSLIQRIDESALSDDELDNLVKKVFIPLTVV